MEAMGAVVDLPNADYHRIAQEFVEEQRLAEEES